MIKKLSGLGLIALFFGVIGTANATPVAFGDNYYEFVEVTNPYEGTNNSWETANIAASELTYHGVNGHLATVTSAEENSFLLDLVAGDYAGTAGAWLGGKAPEGWLAGPEGGDSLSYTNWGGIEPNNSGYIYMLIGDSSHTGIAPGKWADGSGYATAHADPVIGYFVEYENAVNLPAPAAGVLIGIGLVSLMIQRREKKEQGVA